MACTNTKYYAIDATINWINMTGCDGIKLIWLHGQFWNDLNNHLITFVLLRYIPDMDIISINHNHCYHWNDNTN